MKQFLLLYYTVMLSTVVTLTHCCSSRRLSQRRPPSSTSTQRYNSHRVTPTPYTSTSSVVFTDSKLPTLVSTSQSSPQSFQASVASVTVTSLASSSNYNRLGGGTTNNDSNCTSDYRKHYCLNNGICFNYTIQQNFTLLSCLCADGFYGERCEDKYLEGSYSTKIRSNKHIMLHIASIQYGLVAAMAVVIVVFYIKKVSAKTKLTKDYDNNLSNHRV